eukprot:COSAG05_NODE_5796_length_1084_cov_60542.341785_1_plen_311_part_10
MSFLPIGVDNGTVGASRAPDNDRLGCELLPPRRTTSIHHPKSTARRRTPAAGRGVTIDPRAEMEALSLLNEMYVVNLQLRSDILKSSDSEGEHDVSEFTSIVPEGSSVAETERYLRNVPAFAKLSDDKLRKVSRALNLQSFSAGETLILKGQVATHFFLLKSGTVDFIVDDGGEVKRTYENAGAYFGEIALMNNHSLCTATARTATGCECYMIDKSAFDRLLKKSLAVTLESTMASLLDEEEKDESGALLQTTASRARRISALVDASGDDDARQIRLRDQQLLEEERAAAVADAEGKRFTVLNFHKGEKPK